MRGWIRALAAFAFLAPAAAWAADTAAPWRSLSNGCGVYTLCNAQSATGVCGNGSANYVADVSGRYAMTVYATSSTATTFTCDLYTSDNGYQATTRTALTSSGASTQLSYAASRFSVSIAGTLASLWAECTTAITGGTVTINAYVCPLDR
jgi:hypothetical protein